MAEPYILTPVTGQRTSFFNPTLTNSVYSNISYWKDPVVSNGLYNRWAEREEFDRVVEPFYKPIEEDLMLAATKAEFDVKKELYLKKQADRGVTSKASVGQTLAAGLLDPLAAIPVFRFARGVTATKQAINLGGTATAIAVGEEAIRYSSMPDYDWREGAAYIGASAVLGSGLGFGIAKGKGMFNGAMTDAHRRIQDHSLTILEMEKFGELQARLASGAKMERPFKSFGDQELTAEVQNMTQRIHGIAKTIAEVEDGVHPVLGSETLDGLVSSLNKTTKERDIVIDEMNKRRLDEGLTVSEDPYSLAASFLDKLDILPTPIKTIARFKLPENASPELKQAINRFKKSSLLLAGDSSLLYAGQKLGMTLPPSVHIRNQLRRADVIQFESELTRIWKDATDAPRIAPNLVRKATRSSVSLDKWAEKTLIKHITGENLTAKEKEAAELFQKYFDRMRNEATGAGVIGSSNFLQSRIIQKKSKIDNDEDKLRRARENGYKDAEEYWSARIIRHREDLAELENSLAYVTSGDIRPMGKKEPYFMRMWDHRAIELDEKGSQTFRTILTNWIRQNPFGVKYNNKTGLHERADLTGDLEAQDKYVDSVIRSILSDDVPSDIPTSKSIKFPSRAIAIPNSEVVDFINTNVREVIRTYNTRMGSKIDFANMFKQNYDELADELTGDLLSNGMKLEDVNELRQNLTILYRRVTASTLDNPTSLSAKAVQFLKEYASLNYLGGAGITAIGDIPKMVMEHGFKDIFRASLGAMESASVQRQFHEIKGIYGEAVELSLGIVQQRVLEETGVKVGSDIWNSVKNIGFIANGLGPMTVGLKTISGTLSVHKFIQIAKNVEAGKTSNFELEFAARYGLDPKHLKAIAKAPTEMTDRGLNVGNISEWANSGVPTETIVAFRAAVSQNIANTILTSSPATRFKYADGSVFLKIKNARKIMPNIQEDPSFPGYARWEMPIATLPFQFYNFSMSAMANILQTSAQGQLKSKYAGFATMIGMGYLIAKIKTPSWAWEEMDYDQRFMAAIERSGISSVYGDVAFNSIRVGVQLGLNDPDNDAVRLPYYGEDGFAEGMMTIMGAGPSTIKDFVDAGAKIGQQEYADAAREFYFSLPLTQLFWVKEDSKAFIDYATKSAFGRQ